MENEHLLHSFGIASGDDAKSHISYLEHRKSHPQAGRGSTRQGVHSVIYDRSAVTAGHQVRLVPYGSALSSLPILRKS